MAVVYRTQTATNNLCLIHSDVKMPQNKNKRYTQKQTRNKEGTTFNFGTQNA